MLFSMRTYLKAYRLSFSPSRNAKMPFTAKRLLLLVGVGLILPAAYVFNAMCMLLDEVLFSGYRRVELDRPVFIVGNPRSGTTLLHRVLARDMERFFVFRTWEVMFPAIIQKKLIGLFGRADAALGGYARRGLERLESRLLRGVSVIHPMSLFAVEEEESVLAPLFLSFNIIWFFPFEELLWLCQLDRDAPPRLRKRIMRYYRSCIRRQAYYRGEGKKQFISKNAFFVGRIDSLYEYFPGCRIVYMVRNPLEVIPSIQSLTYQAWHSIANIQHDNPIQEHVYKVLKEFYVDPPERLQKVGEERYMIVDYEELLAQPRTVIHELYSRFGFEMSEAFSAAVREEDQKMRQYRSRHHYTVDQFGLSRERIVSDLASVFERYGFADHGDGGNDAGQAAEQRPKAVGPP